MSKPLRWIAATTPVAMALGVVSLLWLLQGTETRSTDPLASGEGRRDTGPALEDEIAGSASCRPCHERFYEKWATSWHGLAMRPATPQLVRDLLVPVTEPIEIRGRRYRVEIAETGATVHESGPGGEKPWPIAQILGGKNLCYFLTPFPGGRLQVLPLAFDTRAREWYDTTASMVRHFHEDSDSAIDWTDRLLTFNASCYTCHVSQLATNYDLTTDTYRTTWVEPGINCESCHGPARRHVEGAVAAGGSAPDPLGVILTRKFSPDQTNAMCAHCHAKATLLGDDFLPGERFFDHFNIAALEDRDFYADGRELGENYTFGPFLMSPCTATPQLDCMHCHTSSGRDKNAGAPDHACLPCHEKHVRDPAAHSFHKAEGEGSRCVSCHMPMTTFARMRRHDHTLLPPTPAATLEFGSPNACNICHSDKDAKWADDWVRKWYPRDFQAPLIDRARLVDAARKRDWSKLPGMLQYVTRKDRNVMFAAGLLRLARSAPSEWKWPAYLQAVKDPSPLVRASAAAALADCMLPEAREALARATQDDTRLVRIESAAALVGRPLDGLSPELRASVQAALSEHLANLRSRPDDPSRHYNLGNLLQDLGEFDSAVASYETAARLDPHLAPALVNLSVLYARLGQPAKAEEALKRVLRIAPDQAEANFNLGLLLAEMGRTSEAEGCLRRALAKDPKLAQAAYNLAVIVAETHPSEAIDLCRRAATLRPDEPRYGYTLAFYQRRSGDAAGAVETLRGVLATHPGHADSVALLGAIHEEEGRIAEAAAVYRVAAGREELPAALRADFAAKAAALERR